MINNNNFIMNKQRFTCKAKGIIAVLFTGLIMSCNSNDFSEGSQTNSQSQSIRK